MLDRPSLHDAVSGAIKIPTQAARADVGPIKNYFLFFVAALMPAASRQARLVDLRNALPSKRLAALY
jgi:hypothetical protein